MSKRIKTPITFEKYLVVKCVELDDQWECDADRTPICIIDEKEYRTYAKRGFELYGILPNGNLRLVKEYDDQVNKRSPLPGRTVTLHNSGDPNLCNFVQYLC